MTVDGKPYPYRRSGTDLSLSMTIPAGESCLINIEYENDLDIATVNISKNDPRVNRLRKLSDFRDMTLSKSAVGQSIIYIYYETDLYKLGLKRLAIICTVLSVAVGVGGWYLLRYVRRGRLQRRRIVRQIKG